MGRWRKFNSTKQKIELCQAMGQAIENMIGEVKKPVTDDVTGSARKAELQSIKQTAVDCKILIRKRDELEEMIDQAYAEQGKVWDEDVDEVPYQDSKVTPDEGTTKRRAGRPKKGEEVNQPKPEPPRISFSKTEEDFSAGFAEEFAADA